MFTFGVAVSMLFFSGCLPQNASTDRNSTLNTSSIIDQLTGTVAIGEGASADITLVGANGIIVEGRSLSDGSYSVSTTGLTQPIMVRAVLDNDGTTMYSFAESTSGIVNVTPLTSFLVDQAAIAAGLEGGSSQLFASFRETVVPNSLINDLDAQTNLLNNQIAPTMESENVGDFDHFYSQFDANHAGYDAVLDELDIEIYQDDIIIRLENGTLDTLNYDISVNEINVTARIFDISTEKYINGATVTFTNRTDVDVTSTTDIDGSFTLSVETMRIYDVIIEAEGYETQYIPEVHSFLFTDTNIGDIPMFPINESELSQLSGLVFNARTTNTGIENATLTFRDGYYERIDSPAYVTTTSADGTYSLTLPSGVYTVEITHNNFNKTYRIVEIFNAQTNRNFSLLASSNDDANETTPFATIVLNWDEDPSDLDSHLTGPQLDTNNSRFHLAYYNTIIDSSDDYNNSHAFEDYTLETNSSLYYDDNYTGDLDYYINPVSCADGITASLDRDDTDGYGPETTTICQTINNGLYKYYVHHYDGDTTMSEGNAKVTVTTKSGVTRIFTAPSANSNGTDDVWHVFNIDSFGNIYPINEIIGSEMWDSSTLFTSPSFNHALHDVRFDAETRLLNNLPSK